MERPLLRLAITAAAGTLLFFGPANARAPRPAKNGGRVLIIQGPALEIVRDDMAIIRWTTSNPGGANDHLGVVYYGTDPENLDQVAKSHIKLNRGHPETIFRVRLEGLRPRTTYYYKATSMERGGKRDGGESSVNRFTTTRPGERLVSHPPRQSRPR